MNRRKEVEPTFRPMDSKDDPYKRIAPITGNLLAEMGERKLLPLNLIFEKNKSFLEGKNIPLDGINKYVLKNKDLKSDYFTLFEAGIPEDWMCKKPTIFNCNSKVKAEDYEILKINFGLDEDTIFEFIDMNLGEYENCEMRQKLYEAAGINVWLRPLRDTEEERLNEELLSTISVANVSKRFKEFSENISLPIDSYLIKYKRKTRRKLKLMEKNGINPPYDPISLARPYGQLELNIESLKQRDIDLNKFRRLLNLGITTFTLVEVMLDMNGDKEYENFDTLMFDLRKFEKTLDEVTEEPNLKIKKKKKAVRLKRKRKTKTHKKQLKKKNFFQRLFGGLHGQRQRTES